MEQIYPKKFKPKQISLLEAVELMDDGEEPFAMVPKDGKLIDYERRDLKEFLEECFEDCIICVDR